MELCDAALSASTNPVAKPKTGMSPALDAACLQYPMDVASQIDNVVFNDHTPRRPNHPPAG
jgi:hypothetical protein